MVVRSIAPGTSVREGVGVTVDVGGRIVPVAVPVLVGGRDGGGRRRAGGGAGGGSRPGRSGSGASGGRRRWCEGRPTRWELRYARKGAEDIRGADEPNVVPGGDVVAAQHPCGLDRQRAIRSELEPVGTNAPHDISGRSDDRVPTDPGSI